MILIDFVTSDVFADEDAVDDGDSLGVLLSIECDIGWSAWMEATASIEENNDIR